MSEHVRARLDLRERVGGHGAQVSIAELLREGLAARRVDALADDAERLLGADGHDLQTATEALCPLVSLSARVGMPRRVQSLAMPASLRNEMK